MEHEGNTRLITHSTHPGSKESHNQSAEDHLERREDMAYCKRKRVNSQAEERPDNKSKMRKADLAGYSRLDSELSQTILTRLGSETGDRDTGVEATVRPEKHNYATANNTDSITIVPENAHQEPEAEQERQATALTSAKNSTFQDDHSRNLKAEAVARQQFFSEVSRVKSVRIELEAVYKNGDENIIQVSGGRTLRNLTVDVQAAGRTQTERAQSPQAVLDRYYSSPPVLSDTPQQLHRSVSPEPLSLWRDASRHPSAKQHSIRAKYSTPIPSVSPILPPPLSQLAYARYVAAREHAHALLSPQASAFPITPLNARHAGPYDPSSPQLYVTSPLPWPASRDYVPRPPVSPSEPLRRPSYPSIHTPRYASAAPKAPTSPVTTQHNAPNDTKPPKRDSVEVMLRKLELAEAEAKLRASITQERLRAEVVAAKKAVARALMMEEKGLQ